MAKTLTQHPLNTSKRSISKRVVRKRKQIIRKKFIQNLLEEKTLKYDAKLIINSLTLYFNVFFTSLNVIIIMGREERTDWLDKTKTVSKTEKGKSL